MRLRLINTLAAILLILTAVGCSESGSSDEDPGSGNSSLVLNRQAFSATADASGKANFTFVLPAGSSSMQLAASEGSLESLATGGANLAAQSAFVSSQQTGATINSPYSSAAGLPGQTFNTSFNAAVGSSVGLQVFSKGDASRSSGTLKLNIVLLGPTGGSEDIMSAVDTALEVARITFSRAGVTLDTQISEFDGPGLAPAPGDALYQSIVSAQRPASITVVIASERRGNKSDEFEYGILGATPFPAIANASSVVVLSLQDITGSDGIFDNSEHNDEERLLGEELARFTARALGLPNIVTIRGTNVTASDDLSDTAGCITEDACREDSSARTNLMFPEPLEKRSEDRESSGNEYYPRDQLTAQQAQVLNNSVLID